METLWSDIRYSLRTLLRDRGFAAVAILTLALGIGANTSIFSLVNSVILRPLAYHQPERLFMIKEVVPSLAHLYPSLPANARHFTEWRRRCRSFVQMSAMLPTTLNLTGSGEPERIHAARVSANVFSLLGVQPALGRSFLPEEDAPGREQVVILSDSLWKRRFSSDPGLIGRTISLDGLPHQVAGILPPFFRFPGTAGLGPAGDAAPRTEIFKPIAFSNSNLEAPFGEFNYGVIGRLRPGVAPRQALAELDPIEAEFARMLPDKLELKAMLTPLQEQVVGQAQRGLVILLAAVGAVLLIVCVNLANLQLARAQARGRDAVIRSALGASRWRILRQTLTETLLLGAIGGAAGIALAYWGLGLLLKTAPLDLPRLDEIRLDGRVLGFAAAISALSGMLFGFLPAWRLTRGNPQQILGSGSRTMTEGRRGLRLRGTLVSFEVGLSALLLITAGLLMMSFVRLMNVDKGFQAERVIAADLNLPSAKYAKHEDRIRFYRQMLGKIEAIPGVVSAAVISHLPLQGETWVDVIWPQGDPKPMFQQPLTNYRFISSGYFKTMGIPLRLGRAIEESDGGRPVVMVSERAAQRVWPGQNPLGKRFRRGNDKEEPFEVIGVVGDTRTKLESEPVLVAYVPYWYRSRTRMSVVVRTAIEPRAVSAAVRSAVWAVDSEVPVSQIRTMSEVVSGSVAQRRFQMQLAAVFAAAALLLASIGIYGVVSYTVTRRRNEIAIRMALGAAAADVRRLVLRDGLTPVALGLAAGVAAALASGRALRSLLFGVSATDPLTISAVVGLLAAVAALACYLPALRATRVAPTEALRYQ